MPVDLWHGELDTNVPMPMARYMAAELPTCTPHIHPNDGHPLLFDYAEEILSGLDD